MRISLLRRAASSGSCCGPRERPSAGSPMLPPTERDAKANSPPLARGACVSPQWRRGGGAGAAGARCEARPTRRQAIDGPPRVARGNRCLAAGEVVPPASCRAAVNGSRGLMESACAPSASMAIERPRGMPNRRRLLPERCLARHLLSLRRALPEERLALRVLISERAEVLRQPPFGHRVACDGARPLDVALCARGDGIGSEHDLLGQATAEQGRDLALQLALAGTDAVAFRQEQRHAQCSPARNNADLVQRVLLRDQAADDGVADLVVRGQAFVHLTHGHRAAFLTQGDLVLRTLEFFHAHHAPVGTRGEQRRFVDQVCKIGTLETRCPSGDGARIDIVADRHLAHVQRQDLLATPDIR